MEHYVLSREIVDTNLQLFNRFEPRGDFDPVRVKRLISAGVSKTLVVDGEPVFIWGFVEPWHGLAELWACPSAVTSLHTVVIFRSSIALTKRYAYERKWRRSQFTIRSDDLLLHRWAAGLIHCQEARLARFHEDGTDALLMVRLWDEGQPALA